MAALAVIGGIVAWLTIDSAVLERDPSGEPPEDESAHLECGIGAPPLRRVHDERFPDEEHALPAEAGG
jgi:hypothetical protein